MLVLLPAKPEKSSFWFPGAAYAVHRGEAEIGRIDLSGKPARDGGGTISLGERAFACRIHITGRARLAHVPSRWVMYEGDVAQHAAVWESGRTFLTEGPDPLRLRRRNFAADFALERTSEAAPIGEIRWLRGRLLPKPVAPRIELETTVALAATLEVFLLWIAVQDAFRSGG